MFRRFASLVAAALPLFAVSAGAEVRPKIAVLPVVVHALEQKDYLQSGLSDMLATRLEQNGKLTVARITDAAQATTDGEAARAAARAVGADYVVFGSFTRFGDGASLDLRCLPTAGAKDDAPKGVFVQAGKVGEIIPRLDDVADRVARYATTGGAGAPAVGAGPVAGGTSGSPEALGDALSELDELRSRVERLESALYGKEGAAPPPGAGKQP
jgi:outer membrane protein insertion porin family